MKNIILIGMMGAGKTTVGQEAAALAGRRFVDTDRLIEEREGKSVAVLFEEKGEGYFRAAERQVAEELSAQSNVVIACGGGLPFSEGAMGALSATGTVFLLKRAPEDIYDGLTPAERLTRPLCRNGREAFIELAARRESVYERWADVTVKSDTPRRMAELILRLQTEREREK